MAAPAEGSPMQDDVRSIVSDEELYLVSDVESEAAEDDDSIPDGEEQYTAAQQAAKAIEAAQDGNSTSTRSIASTSRSPSLAPSRALSSAASSFWYHPPRRNRRNSSPGPPNYAEAITQSAYLPPQSGAHDEDAISLHSPSDGSKRSCMSRCRQLWKRLCLLNLAVYCIVITTVILVKWMLADSTMSTKQHLRPNWSLAENFHIQKDECQVEATNEFNYFEWESPTNFSFLEAMYPISHHDYQSAQVSGKVEIRPAPYNQKSSIYVIASTASTPDWAFGSPEFQQDPDGLRLTLSHSASPPPRSHHDLRRRDHASMSCLSVWVGIYVRDAPQNWDLQTNGMDIAIGRQQSHGGVPYFTLTVADTTRISTQSGDIDVVHLDSRCAYISSASGTITGNYALREELHLQTNNGDIAIEIERQTSLEKAQSRPSNPHPSANLSTTTFAGDQAIRLLQPLKGLVWSGSSYGHTYPIHSHHTSNTGQIQIFGNSYWEGTVDASTTAGSIEIRGTDLIPSPSLTASQESSRRDARKGSEDSTMTVHTLEGAIDICIDDLEKC